MAQGDSRLVRPGLDFDHSCGRIAMVQVNRVPHSCAPAPGTGSGACHGSRIRGESNRRGGVRRRAGHRLGRLDRARRVRWYGAGRGRSMHLRLDGDPRVSRPRRSLDDWRQGLQGLNSIHFRILMKIFTKKFTGESFNDF